jgi:type VI secretion system secreted protein Hcp
MNMRSLIFCIGTALIGVTAQGALGAEVFLVQVPNVAGDVILAGYKNWISVDSFSAGFSNPDVPNGTGASVGKGICQPIQIQKPLDRTSPLLSAAAFQGNAFPTVTLTALAPLGSSYYAFLTLTLSDAVISSLTMAGNGAASAQEESLTLVYGKLTVSYSALNPATGVVSVAATRTVDCILGTVN